MKLYALRKKFVSLLLPLLMFTQAGCVYVVVGSLGALGGYVVSPDTVEGVSARDVTDVWDASVEVLNVMGLIEEQQEAGGLILAKVHGTKVTVNVMPLGTGVKLSVKARRAKVFPKIKLAQDVYIKIMTRLGDT